MTHPFRDDCPPEYNLLRRDFLGRTAMSVALATASGEVALANTAPPLTAAKFMQISSLLIDHQLDAEIGTRLAGAIDAAYPGTGDDIDALLQIAQKNNAKIVEDFFPDVPAGRLQDTALRIISAWYSGVVTETLGSEVYAYELALMYQPTRDVMTIPSYAISGPNGWRTSGPQLSDMPEF